MGPEETQSRLERLEMLMQLYSSQRATAGLDGLLSYAGFAKLALLLTKSGSRVYNSANIAVASGVSTSVTYDSELYDTDAYHSTAANTSRLTAPWAGNFLLVWHGEFAASAAGTYRGVTLLNSAGGVIARDFRPPFPGGAIPTRLVIATYVELAASDWVEAKVDQDSGGSLNLLAATHESAEFMIVPQGR